MGLREKLFGERDPLAFKPGKAWQMPALLEPNDPVNYDSVLDWMLGLSEAEYKLMRQVITIYRDADQKAAQALGVEVKPTTFIKGKKLTSKQIDDGLDQLLVTPPKVLKAAMQIDHKKPKSRRKVSKK